MDLTMQKNYDKNEDLNKCKEFPDVYCDLGRYYPHCDMFCELNIVSKNKYLYNTGKPQE